MARKSVQRRENEQGMLNNIAGRDDGAGSAPPPKKKSSIGWMAYVGGALWAMVLGGAGFAAWLVFAGGA